MVFPAYLIREKFVDKEYYGLTCTENFYDIKNFTEGRLQNIIDTFVAEISELKPKEASDETQKCLLENELAVNMPSWYLMFQGHDLEGFLKGKYKQLQRFRREGDLKKEIIQKLYDDIPEIFSRDLSELFRSIREN